MKRSRLSAFVFSLALAATGVFAAGSSGCATKDRSCADSVTIDSETRGDNGK